MRLVKHLRMQARRFWNRFMMWEVFVPSDKLGDVMSDMQGRRGMIMGMTSEKGYEKLSAKVPLKEMSNYSTALSSLTGGRASFIMKFASYELVPTDVQTKLMKEFEEQEKVRSIILVVIFIDKKAVFLKKHGFFCLT